MNRRDFLKGTTAGGIVWSGVAKSKPKPDVFIDEYTDETKAIVREHVKVYVKDEFTDGAIVVTTPMTMQVLYIHLKHMWWKEQEYIKYRFPLIAISRWEFEFDDCYRLTNESRTMMRRAVWREPANVYYPESVGWVSRDFLNDEASFWGLYAEQTRGYQVV